jgi:transposase-like protein
MDATTTQRAPKTLTEAVRYYADLDRCQDVMAAVRWPNGVTCPACGSSTVSYIRTRRLWECREKPRHAKRQFSVKVGTIFEDSPLGLDKWMPAVWLIANCKNGVSSHELGRALGVTQKTAWFMLHRIRLAMSTGTFDKLSGTVEVDETFIGGRARFIHKDKREAKIIGTGPLGKIAVMGLLERHGPDRISRVRLKIMPNRRRHAMQAEVRANVKPGAEVFTDELKSYTGLAVDYQHEVINHAESYVRGKVHTNGLENFWSLFKRAIKGTYVSTQPFHLFRYMDEQTFRFNHRSDNDGGRFMRVLRNVLGQRVTYRALTGKLSPA